MLQGPLISRKRSNKWAVRGSKFQGAKKTGVKKISRGKNYRFPSLLVIT